MEYRKFQKQVNFLLDNACPSIKYLVYRDMLNADVNEPFMVELQGEILLQSNVKKHLSAQHPDGWFGHEIHGNDGMDCHIGGLLNLGVESDNIAIQKAIIALTTPEISNTHKNWFRGGDALDAEERGGNRAVRANILSMAKASEHILDLADEISLAFEHLSAVLQYKSVDDFTIKGKNERYYRPKARFPGANHIGVLSATNSWRTEANLQTAKAAVKHAYELMKDFDEYITFKKPSEFGGGFVGPFNYNWQALNPLTEQQVIGIIMGSYNFGFAFWLGSVSGVPAWVKQSNTTYEVLADMLDRDVIFDMLSDKTLTAFRKVMGKESNYRKKYAAKCDVLYAVLKAVWSRV